LYGSLGVIRAFPTRRSSDLVALFVAPNFALGAVVMMRLAAEAGRLLPRAEIVELHGETKKDSPSGTAKATAELLGGEVPIHSVRSEEHTSELQSLRHLVCRL